MSKESQSGQTTSDRETTDLATEVLVIDDDPMIRHILLAVLKKAGKIAEGLASGREGLDELQRSLQKGTSPSVVFLDLQLLDMSGAEVLTGIADIFREPTLKPRIVLLSAHTEEEARQHFPNISYDCFLQKPFTPQQVLEVLAS